MRCQVFMMAVPLFKRSLHRMHQILRSHIIGPNFDFDENHETSFLNCHCEHYIFVKSSLLPGCRFNFEQDCRPEQLQIDEIIFSVVEQARERETRKNYFLQHLGMYIFPLPQFCLKVLDVNYFYARLMTLKFCCL